MRATPRPTLLIAFLLILGGAAADAAGAAGDRRFPLGLRGFLLGAVSGRTTGVQPPRAAAGDLVLAEERLRLELTGATAGGALVLARGDLLHDAVAARAGGELREAYASLPLGPLDVAAGRQILTWGVGDLLFIDDIFPKDWESFFSGRPMEYLKLGVDGLRLRGSRWALSPELLLLPFFTPDDLPTPERFVFFDPFSEMPTREEEPDPGSPGSPELALRLRERLAGLDVSFYAYRGFWRTPSLRLEPADAPAAVIRFYPRLGVYGASAQGNALGGVVSLEAGRYDSRQDRAGGDPAVPNSEWRLLGGYQRQVGPDAVIGVQLYGEAMAEHDDYLGALPPGMPARDEFRGVASVRWTQFLAYQSWKLSLFGTWSPTDEDGFLQPEATWKATDRLSLSLGANIFEGESEVTFFGQLERSDNLFMLVRFDFSAFGS
jgi:hypothetical protein